LLGELLCANTTFQENLGLRFRAKTIGQAIADVKRGRVFCLFTQIAGDHATLGGISQDTPGKVDNRSGERTTADEADAKSKVPGSVRTDELGHSMPWPDS
jgi:hypothetical protein